MRGCVYSGKGPAQHCRLTDANNKGRRLCGLIVRVRVVPRRTVVGDIDRHFDNLSGSHHQSHVNCVSSVYGINKGRDSLRIC